MNKSDKLQIYRAITQAREPQKQIDIEASLYGVSAEEIGKIFNEVGKELNREPYPTMKRRPGRPKAMPKAENEKAARTEKTKELKLDDSLKNANTLPPIPKIVFDKIEDDLRAANLHIKELEIILQEQKEVAADLKSFLDAYKPE